MSQVTTHVLDAAFGTPAVGVGVTLDRQSRTTRGARSAGARRTRTAASPSSARTGWRAACTASPSRPATTSTPRSRPSFYPEVQITFRVSGTEHFHVPLLLSPFAYSTYRGS